LQPLQQVGKRWIIDADNMMAFLEPGHACAKNLGQSQKVFTPWGAHALAPLRDNRARYANGSGNICVLHA
jgi:hypothetical protein